MNTYINYLIEANLGLALLLLAYVILLRKETDFKAKRLYMLIGILASALFPLFHLQGGGTKAIPSISTLVSTYWLPEIVITGDGKVLSPSSITWSNVLICLPYLYAFVLLFFLVRFLIQLIGLIRIIATSKGYRLNDFQIVESNENQTTFSFFNFIFIGQANSLSADDKNKIIQHETVHAKQLHSFDIVLLNVLGIFFWFNPLIKRYKKIFVQLHEFEADARAVENTEVNEYCNLLAKVALQSADYTLANHFNQSLTLKRIEMMRTIKHKIKPWKIVTLASVIFFLFFIVACQDQLADATDIAKNSTMALDIPDDIQKQFDEIKQSNPNGKYVIIEVNENREAKLEEMKPVLEEFVKRPDQIESIHVIKGERNFIIVEQKSLDQISELSAFDGVFTIVDEPASPKGGMTSFYEYVSKSLSYPVDARKDGIQGKVFIEFVVNTDGSISDLRVLKGIGKGCDEEAFRVMSESAAWIPGKQNGKIVRQKMVIPFSFQLGDGESKPQKVGLNFRPPIRLLETKVIADNC